MVLKIWQSISDKMGSMKKLFLSLGKMLGRFLPERISMFRKKESGWLAAASLAFALLILYLIPDSFYGQYPRMPEELVTLSANGLKNDHALGCEVILKYIMLDGRKVDAADYVTKGKWVTNKNVLNWRNYEAENVTNEIVFRLPAAHNRALVFESWEWRGICEVTYQGRKMRIDCYDSGYQEKPVFLNGEKRYGDWFLGVIKFFVFLLAVVLFYWLFYGLFHVWSRKTGRNISADLFAFVMLFLLVLRCMSRHTDGPWSYRIPFTDSDNFLYGGWAMTRGEVLYTDFWDHKGPYMYFLQWLGWAAAGSYVGVWLLELAAVFVAVAASYRMLRKRTGVWTAFMSVVIGYWYLACYLSFGNYTESYTLPLISVSALIFQSYFDRKPEGLSRVECVALGILFTVAFLIRPNSIAVWVVYCFAITVWCLMKKQFAKLGYYMSGFIPGMGIAFLPVGIYMTIHHAWDGFFEFFTFNFQYVEAGGNKWTALCYFLVAPVCLTALAGILYGLYKSRGQKNSMEYVCLLGWYALGMLFTAMAGGTWNHYGSMTLPVLPLGVLYAMQGLQEMIEKQNTVKIMCVCVSLGMMSAAVCMTEERGNYRFLDENKWTVQYTVENDLDLKVISRIIRENTKTDERISVFGNACQYYLCSGRLSCSKYFFQEPVYHIDEEIGKKYVDDLEKKAPGAIVVKAKETLKNQDDGTAQRMRALLDQCYEQEYEGESADLYLLRE